MRLPSGYQKGKVREACISDRFGCHFSCGFLIKSSDITRRLQVVMRRMLCLIIWYKWRCSRMLSVMLSSFTVFPPPSVMSVSMMVTAAAATTFHATRFNEFDGWRRGVSTNTTSCMQFWDAHTLFDGKLITLHDVRPGITMTRHDSFTTCLDCMTQGSTWRDRIVQASVVRRIKKEQSVQKEGNKSEWKAPSLFWWIRQSTDRFSCS